jgi:hypothetical protein
MSDDTTHRNSRKRFLDLTRKMLSGRHFVQPLQAPANA